MSFFWAFWLARVFLWLHARLSAGLVPGMVCWAAWSRACAAGHAQAWGRVVARVACLRPLSQRGDVGRQSSAAGLLWLHVFFRGALAESSLLGLLRRFFLPAPRALCGPGQASRPAPAPHPAGRLPRPTPVPRLGLSAIQRNGGNEIAEAAEVPPVAKIGVQRSNMSSRASSDTRHVVDPVKAVVYASVHHVRCSTTHGYGRAVTDPTVNIPSKPAL